MTAITLRSVKGSPLTMTEMDDNFNNLNTAKVETSAVGTAAAENVMYFDRLLATYSSIGAGTHTIKIKLPAGMYPTGMMTFRIDVYSNYNIESYTCAGYLYQTNSNWYAPIVRYEAVGNSAAMTPSAMTFGMDGTNPYVSLTVGDFAGVAVRGQTQGYINAAANYLIDGWSITEDATIPNPVTPQIITSWNSQNFQPASKLSASANLSDVASVPVSRANLGLGTAATKNAQISLVDVTPGALMGVGAFGWTVKAVDISSTDLDTLTTPGLYNGSSLVNAPDATSNTWWYIEVAQHSNSAAYALQIATVLNDTPERYYRTSLGSAWVPWKQLWDSGNFDPTTKLSTASNLSDLANITTALINLGLNQVNNTSDVNKPVSTAQQAALDLKAALSGGAAANFAAMPQVGGSPIVESGSNASGNWIKWADGTMICAWRNPDPSSFASAGGISNAGLTIGFPIAFVAEPRVLPATILLNNLSWSGATQSISATGCNLILITNSTAGADFIWAYVAIGSWK